MTFERFYSIIRPYKAASFNTVKRAKITIMCVVAFSILYNIPGWFVSARVENSRSCVGYANGLHTIAGKIYYWTSSVLNYGLPFVLLLIMNTVIINTLRKRSKSTIITRPGHSGHTETETESKNSERQIFVILIVISFAYFILNVPAYIYIFISFAGLNKQNPYHLAAFHLYISVAQKALYTNYGINFYLYVISGQKFRKDLLLLLRPAFNLITGKISVTKQTSCQKSVSDISSSEHPEY